MVDSIVSFKLTAEQLDEIRDWLIIENKRKRGFAGFYCNWKQITGSFSENELAVILLDGQVIGFMTWLLSEKVANLQIGEIRPGFRKKGYGRILMEAVLAKMKQKGCMVAYLHCQPATAEKAWRKIGFKRYPNVTHFADHIDLEQGRYLYQILVPHLMPVKTLAKGESISLWSVERYQAERFAPQWKWSLTFKKDTRKLALPIIAPAYQKWNISWNMDGKEVKSDQIKYFAKDELEFSGFLIMEHLPLPQPR